MIEIIINDRAIQANNDTDMLAADINIIDIIY